MTHSTGGRKFRCTNIIITPVINLLAIATAAGTIIAAEDLDLFEVFAGESQLSAAYRRAGLRASESQ